MTAPSTTRRSFVSLLLLLALASQPISHPRMRTGYVPLRGSHRRSNLRRKEGGKEGKPSQVVLVVLAPFFPLAELVGQISHQRPNHYSPPLQIVFIHINNSSSSNVNGLSLPPLPLSLGAVGREGARGFVVM